MKPIPINALIGRVEGIGEREVAILAKEVGDDIRKLKDWMLSHNMPGGDVRVLIPEYFGELKNQEYADKRDRLFMMIDEMIAEAKMAEKDKRFKAGGSGVSGASPTEGKVPGSSPDSRTIASAGHKSGKKRAKRKVDHVVDQHEEHELDDLDAMRESQEHDEEDEKPRPIQTDLAGQKLEVKETRIMKESIIYSAQHYQVSVSQDEDALDRLSALDAGDRMPWLKARMRVIKDHDPSGKDMDADAKVLFAAVFS